jgi:hypothetical protein
VSYIKQSVVVILAAGETLGLELVVINPNGGGLVQSKGVSRFLWSIELQVSNNNVADFLKAESTVGDTYSRR